MTMRDAHDDALKLYHTMALVAARDGKTEALTEVLRDHPQLCKRREATELLHIACAEGHEACITALLAGGIPINATDAQGFSAIDHAAIHHQWKLIPHLLECGANPDGSQRGFRHGKPTPLLMATHDGDIDAMNALIQGGASTHYQDSRGENMLHHAARAKTNQKEVMAIAKANTSPAMQGHMNCEEHTPLQVAIHLHNSAVIDALRQQPQHRQRQNRTTGRVPIQSKLFDDPKGGDSRGSGRSR